jgi:hypothetical protein
VKVDAFVNYNITHMSFTSFILGALFNNATNRAALPSPSLPISEQIDSWGGIKTAATLYLADTDWSVLSEVSHTVSGPGNYNTQGIMRVSFNAGLVGSIVDFEVTDFATSIANGEVKALPYVLVGNFQWNDSGPGDFFYYGATPAGAGPSLTVARFADPSAWLIADQPGLIGYQTLSTSGVVIPPAGQVVTDWSTLSFDVQHGFTTYDSTDWYFFDGWAKGFNCKVFILVEVNDALYRVPITRSIGTL